MKKNHFLFPSFLQSPNTEIKYDFDTQYQS